MKRQWVHDQLRERLLSRDARLVGAGTGHPVSIEESKRRLAELEETEWSSEFEELMRNRLLMGALRYGRIKENRGKPYKRVEDAVRRLSSYLEGGNLEHLVDAANLILLEFECGNHPKRHMESVDDGEHCELREAV